MIIKTSLHWNEKMESSMMTWNCPPWIYFKIVIRIRIILQVVDEIRINKFNLNMNKLFIEMLHLNTIEQLLLYVEQLYQLKICLPYSRLLTWIPILAVFQNLRWNSNKISLKLFTGTYVVCRSQNTLKDEFFKIWGQLLIQIIQIYKLVSILCLWVKMSINWTQTH